jgi:hypothetical protein
MSILPNWAILVMATLANLSPLVATQGIRFPDQDPPAGSVGSALAGLTLNQLAIVDRISAQVCNSENTFHTDGLMDVGPRSGQSHPYVFHVGRSKK